MLLRWIIGMLGMRFLTLLLCRITRLMRLPADGAWYVGLTKEIVRTMDGLVVIHCRPTLTNV